MTPDDWYLLRYSRVGKTLPKVYRLLKMEKITMEIQTNGRIPSTAYETLVLHFHLTFEPISHALQVGVAEIYETPAQAKDDCDPLFHGYGEGLQEFSTTLACLDCWLQGTIVPRLKGLVESWILSCSTGRTGTYFISATLCRETNCAYIRLAEAWFCPEPGHSPTPVAGISLRQESAKIPITKLTHTLDT